MIQFQVGIHPYKHVLGRSTSETIIKTMRTLFTRTALSAAVFSCLTLSAVAHANSNTIETLTVTGSRLTVQVNQFPGSVTILTESQIKASGAVQLTELIRGLPGVSISQSGSPGGLTEVRVRGSETNHLLVLIDGVVANDVGQGSLIDLAHLTSANVVRIELLNGPQSARWGSGAIGGVLSITTKAGQFNQASEGMTLSVGAGTQDTYQANLNGTTQLNNLGITAYVNFLDTDGDNIARQGNENDGYQNTTAGINFNYAHNDVHTFVAQLRSVEYQNDYDGTDYVTTGLPTDSDNVTDGAQLSTKLQWSFTPTYSAYRATLTTQYRKDKNDNTTAKMDAGGTTGERIEVNWTGFYSQESWQFAGGAEYLQRLFSQRGPVDYGDPNHKQHDNTNSAFGELNVQWSDTVSSSLSARYDNNSEFDDASSYRAGVTWQVSDSYALFTSLGKAVKTPTFTERFGYYPASFIGNPNLQPETSQEWEVGIKGSWQRIRGQVSWYNADLENEINGFVYNPELGAYSAANVDGKSDRQGLEMSFDWASALGTLTASYSYLDAHQTDSGVTTTELRRARHQGALTFASSLGTQRLSAYAKLAYTGTRFDTYFPPYPAPSQTLALSAYTLASVNVSYRMTDNWQASVKVNNLFDTDYEDIVGYAGQERRVLVSVNYAL